MKREKRKKDENNFIGIDINLEEIQSRLNKYNLFITKKAGTISERITEQVIKHLELKTLVFGKTKIVFGSDGFFAVYNSKNNLCLGFIPNDIGMEVNSDGVFIIQNKDFKCYCNMMWRSTEEIFFDERGKTLIINDTDVQGTVSSIFKGGQLLCRVFKAYYDLDYVEDVHYFEHKNGKVIETTSDGKITKKNPAFDKKVGGRKYTHILEDLSTKEWYSKPGLQVILDQGNGNIIFEIEVVDTLGEEPFPIESMCVNFHDQYGRTILSRRYVVQR